MVCSIISRGKFKNILFTIIKKFKVPHQLLSYEYRKNKKFVEVIFYYYYLLQAVCRKSAYCLNNYINLLRKSADYKRLNLLMKSAGYRRLKMICRSSSANGLFTNDAQRPFKSALQTSISKTMQKTTIKINLLTYMQVFSNANGLFIRKLISKTI